jgi:hypothetical protein
LVCVAVAMQRCIPRDAARWSAWRGSGRCGGVLLVVALGVLMMAMFVLRDGGVRGEPECGERHDLAEAHDPTTDA